MKKRNLSSVVIAVVVVGVTAGTVASAHSTGHEARTASDCEKLPGTSKEGERAGCLACIGRNNAKEKYHFHPDYPAGNRCRPDDGQP